MIPATYEIPAGVLSSAAIIKRIVGPENKRGRITGISAVSTLGLTGSEGQLQLGTTADATAFLTMSIPNTTILERVAGLVTFATSHGGYPAIRPNEILEVATDGVVTAGAADIFITIEWY
jgi:hypothetical protein